jgi:hypothetical protein
MAMEHAQVEQWFLGALPFRQGGQSDHASMSSRSAVHAGSAVLPLTARPQEEAGGGDAAKSRGNPSVTSHGRASAIALERTADHGPERSAAQGPSVLPLTRSPSLNGKALSMEGTGNEALLWGGGPVTSGPETRPTGMAAPNLEAVAEAGLSVSQPSRQMMAAPLLHAASPRGLQGDRAESASPTASDKAFFVHSRPRQAVRIHLHTDQDSTTVWLGVDLAARGLLPQLTAALGQWVTSHGYGKATTWICNGRPIKPDRFTPEPFLSPQPVAQGQSNEHR